MSMRISPVSATNDSQPAASKPADLKQSPLEIQETVIGYPFSTRVGSTTYAGDVQKFANEYHGSVSGLFNVNATGSSVSQVEEHLGNLISFFA
jgi:hypothetical protein